jgi:hypothetical protein
MSKRDKLRERLKNNPQNATFSDIRKLLEQEGFARSHYWKPSYLYKR